MKIEIRKSFEKDADKTPESVKVRLSKIIGEISRAGKLMDINSCKKLTGFKNAYRIRSGSYRIGFFFENNTIELVRILHRKDMYRFFP